MVEVSSTEPPSTSKCPLNMTMTATPNISTNTLLRRMCCVMRRWSGARTGMLSTSFSKAGWRRPEACWESSHKHALPRITVPSVSRNPTIASVICTSHSSA